MTHVEKILSCIILCQRKKKPIPSTTFSSIKTCRIRKRRRKNEVRRCCTVFNIETNNGR
jgi:hypothetical protein